MLNDEEDDINLENDTRERSNSLEELHMADNLIDTPESKSQKFNTFKRIAVSGVGFFSDAYDLFIINIVLVILAKEYYLSARYKSAITSSALWGAALGQIFFGVFADRLGRKKGFILTLSLVIVGAIASALSFETGFSPVFVSLAFFRFVLGIGIGGEYPLSATITAESAKASNRGRMTAAVFSMQGIGSLVAALMGFILITTLGDRSLNLVWRLCLGIGSIPGILSLYFRITMEETERFQQQQRERKTISYKQVFKTYWKTLIGTAGTWFLLDVVFYANGLFSTSVLEVMKNGQSGGDPGDAVRSLTQISLFNIFLTLMALPGYWVGVFLIELPFFGRRNTQIIGFIALGITYIIMGAFYKQLVKQSWLFIVIYGITFFFTNAGPNTTTYVIPSESFPTEVRATCHGISAAAGKLGAIFGAIGMAPLLDSAGISVVFFVCSAVAIVGAVFSYFFTKETKGLSLEQITEEIEMN